MRFRIVSIIALQLWRSSLKNKAVLALTVIIGGMLLFAAFTGWQHYRYQHNMRLQYQQQVREQWLNSPDKHPHRMAHYGYLVFRPKHSLSFFDFGIESFTGVSIFLEAHRQNTVNFSEAGFSTGMLRFGEISVAMILQLLVPLLLFFLGFSSISAERENSTLKVLLCQGVSWQELIAGKTLGITGVALVLYLPVILVTVLCWLLLSRFQVSAGDSVRLLLLIFAYFAYFIICALIAVLVSALSKTSKGALTTLIGIWLLFMIVLPRGTQVLGAQQYPTPSKAAFQAAVEKDLRREGDSHNPDDPHYKAIKDSLLRAYNVDSVHKLPFNYGGFIMAEGERISAEIYARHQQELVRTYEQQNSFGRYAAFINPYLAIKHFSMALTGTDFAAYMDFQQQAEKFRYQLAQRMNRLQMEYISNQPPGPHDKPHSISHAHWAELQDFRYVPLQGKQVYRHERLSIAALVCWLLLPIAALFIITKKFRAL
ncbi:ABC transporter permease [Chitinophaga japonensis]|uniref:ABC-2 type transport system permease protein n=1 Tax=Chitinophaga japonensis TaxID=104662 RepID=A0A562SPD3_CHIJA|nr:DUF3526 domain-containing protein [Chitinophaga japonensis]TWI82546.1 ABC-2 type transport system permease protein [Chitinophaga japonensis]